MNFKHILPLALCTGLVACSSNDKGTDVNLTLRYITTTSAPQQAIDRYAQSALTEAATTANHSLEQLSALELAKHPNTVLPKPADPVAMGLDQHTSIDWNGPAEPLLVQLAKAGNYTLHVLGRSPITPVLVNIRKQDRTVAALLRDVEYQIIAKAAIHIYPKRKLIELAYFPT